MVKRDLLINCLNKINSLEKDIKNNPDKIFSLLSIEGLDENILEILSLIDFNGLNINDFIKETMKRNNLFKDTKISMNKHNVKISSSYYANNILNYEMCVKFALEEVVFIDLYNKSFHTKRDSLESFFKTFQIKADTILKADNIEEYLYDDEIKLPRNQKELLLYIHDSYLDKSGLFSKHRYSKEMCKILYNKSDSKEVCSKRYFKFLLANKKKLIKMRNKIDYDIKRINDRTGIDIIRTNSWLLENKQKIFTEIENIENFLISLGYLKR